MGILLFLIAFFLFVIAYFIYGRYISKILKIDDKNSVPSKTKNDGVDYVPTNRFVLLGHHFASIAGVGPIVGPILGATYGWLPAFLWIVLGSIFLGAVHDFVTLVISIRKEGKTIGTIIKDFLGQEGKLVFLIFTWFTLILVIAVFTIVVAKTFVSHPEAGTASILFLLLALIMGYSIYVARINLGVATFIGVILLFFSVFLGVKFPLKFSYNIWVILLIIYIFLASTMPVWLLLQPRDYLNSFLLYVILLGGILGIFFYKPDIKLEVFTGFYDKNLGYLFPVLFVTIACGAISGFHSLVSSGTSSKQIDKESDAQFVGYGGMLLESILAVLSLITAVMLLRKDFLSAVKNPIALFSNGMGNILNSLGIPYEFAVSFAALAISAFALTSLDTAVRIGRYTFQELFADTKISFLKNKFIAAFITVISGYLFAFNESGVMSIWPVFGSANQMLAALALITGTLFLINNKMEYKITLIPAIFMYLVTLTALGSLVYQNLKVNNLNLTVIGSILFLIAIYVGVLVFKKIKSI